MAALVRRFKKRKHLPGEQLSCMARLAKRIQQWNKVTPRFHAVLVAPAQKTRRMTVVGPYEIVSKSPLRQGMAPEAAIAAATSMVLRRKSVAPGPSLFPETDFDKTTEPTTESVTTDKPVVLPNITSRRSSLAPLLPRQPFDRRSSMLLDPALIQASHLLASGSRPPGSQIQSDLSTSPDTSDPSHETALPAAAVPTSVRRMSTFGDLPQLESTRLIQRTSTFTPSRRMSLAPVLASIPPRRNGTDTEEVADDKMGNDQKQEDT